MGAPAKDSAPGESYWCCPFHNDTNPSFHTRPHNPDYKDRWNCFGCGKWGDEADLLKEFYPNEDWPQRRARLDRLAQDYQREVKPERNQQQTPTQSHHFSFRGPGRPNPTESKDNPGKVAQAWADLTKEERVIVMAARDVMREKSRGVSLDTLGDYCQGVVEWIKETDRFHFAGCVDPKCDARICREGRGLPPLTQEEIKAAGKL
jgi:hypothetical protein